MALPLLSYGSIQANVVLSNVSTRWGAETPPSLEALDYGLQPVDIAPVHETFEPFDLNLSKMNQHLKQVLGLKAVFIRAHTGMGKTTKVPVELYGITQGLVVVVEPTDVLAQLAFGYVSKNATIPIFYVDPSAPQLPDEGVVYVSALAFLLLITSNKLRNVSVLLLDEAHTMSAEYYAISTWLVHNRVVGSLIKISATYRGDVYQGSLAEKIEEVQIRAGDTMVDLIQLVTSGPFSRQYVTRKILLFVPDIEAAREVAKVYKMYGVPFVIFTETSSAEDYQKLLLFLDSSLGGRVVIATRVLETGITLPIDRVWDFTMMPGQVYSTNPLLIQQRWYVITEHMKMQRRGRVGRLGPGQYVYVVRDFRKDSEELTIFQAYRLRLWYQLLNFLPDPDLERRTAGIGYISTYFAEICIKYPLHPLMLRLCFDESGKIYSNLYNFFERNNNKRQMVASDSWLVFDEFPTVKFILPNAIYGFLKDEATSFNSPVDSKSVDFEFMAAIIMFSKYATDYASDRTLVRSQRLFNIEQFEQLPRTVVTRTEFVGQKVSQPSSIATETNSSITPIVSQVRTPYNYQMETTSVVEFIQPEGALDFHYFRPIVGERLFEQALVTGGRSIVRCGALELLLVAYSMAYNWNRVLTDQKRLESNLRRMNYQSGFLRWIFTPYRLWCESRLLRLKRLFGDLMEIKSVLESRNIGFAQLSSV